MPSLWFRSAFIMVYYGFHNAFIMVLLWFYNGSIMLLLHLYYAYITFLLHYFKQHKYLYSALFGIVVMWCSLWNRRDVVLSLESSL
jgi:hypothetical protein